MSYYFIIFSPPSTSSTPLFEHEFGTSRSGGDGAPRFRDEARALNQLVAHAALDMVDEQQWATGHMYLKLVDRFQSTYIFCFLTAANARFVLLACPDANAANASAAAAAAAAAGAAGGGGPAGGGHQGSGRASLGPGRDAAGRSSQLGASTWGAASSTSFSAYAYPSASASGVGGSGSGSSAQYNPTAPATEEAVRSFFMDVYDVWVKAVMSPFYAKGMPVRSPVFRQRVAAAARKYL